MLMVCAAAASALILKFVDACLFDLVNIYWVMWLWLFLVSWITLLRGDFYEEFKGYQ